MAGVDQLPQGKKKQKKVGLRGSWNGWPKRTKRVAGRSVLPEMSKPAVLVSTEGDKEYPCH